MGEERWCPKCCLSSHEHDKCPLCGGKMWTRGMLWEKLSRASEILLVISLLKTHPRLARRAKNFLEELSDE